MADTNGQKQTVRIETSAVAIVSFSDMVSVLRFSNCFGWCDFVTWNALHTAQFAIMLSVRHVSSRNLTVADFTDNIEI